MVRGEGWGAGTEPAGERERLLGERWGREEERAGAGRGWEERDGEREIAREREGEVPGQDAVPAFTPSLHYRSPSPKHTCNKVGRACWTQPPRTLL